MISSFKTFLSEASIRAGLPFIHHPDPEKEEYSMTHEQFKNLIEPGHIAIHPNHTTEKTDGSVFEMGYHPDHGFHTRYSGSGDEKMTSGTHYQERAKRRAAETGKPLDLTAAKAFGHIHDTLARNEKLQDYLKGMAEKKGGEVTMKGEIFNRKLSKPGDHPGEEKFVGTSYRTDHMGSEGKFVIHSNLPVNADHDLNHIKKHLSDSKINFDDDKVKHDPIKVDVKDEKEEFTGLNHDLINSRTSPKNKVAKLAEIGKMRSIQKKVASKVQSGIDSLKIQPKWGSGTEGLVLHPPKSNPSAPRYKVVSKGFLDFKHRLKTGEESFK